MSSLTRRMQRKIARNKSDYEPRPQVTEILENGYHTLHPTKGWRWISNARLAAQMTMARMLDHAFSGRPRKPAKLWRKPAPVPPSTETRQQRRAAARGYRP